MNNSNDSLKRKILLPLFLLQAVRWNVNISVQNKQKDENKQESKLQSKTDVACSVFNNHRLILMTVMTVTVLTFLTTTNNSPHNKINV